MTRRVALIACGVIAAVAISAMLVVGLFMIVTRDTDDHLTEADKDSIQKYVDTLATSD